MVCKSVGPRLVPVGQWETDPDLLFSNNFE
jgi:hypothetical protein